MIGRGGTSILIADLAKAVEATRGYAGSRRKIDFRGMKQQGYSHFWYNAAWPQLSRESS